MLSRPARRARGLCVQLRVPASTARHARCCFRVEQHSWSMAPRLDMFAHNVSMTRTRATQRWYRVGAAVHDKAGAAGGTEPETGDFDETRELYKDQDDTWVDRHAPAYARPYLKLIRIDRPVGAS